MSSSMLNGGRGGGASLVDVLRRSPGMHVMRDGNQAEIDGAVHAKDAALHTCV